MCTSGWFVALSRIVESCRELVELISTLPHCFFAGSASCRSRVTPPQLGGQHMECKAENCCWCKFSMCMHCFYRLAPSLFLVFGVPNCQLSWWFVHACKPEYSTWLDCECVCSCKWVAHVRMSFCHSVLHCVLPHINMIIACIFCVTTQQLPVSLEFSSPILVWLLF